MTDPIAEGMNLVTAAEPAALYTTYLSSIDDAVEHVKAANTLGLGFRLESYEVTGGEDSHPEYEFTLLGDLPARSENEE